MYDTLPSKRAVYCPHLSVRKLDLLLSRNTMIKAYSQAEIERLKDYKWLLLNDVQLAEEKGFYVRYLADNGGVPVLKNKCWLVNIDAAITAAGSDPCSLTNNDLYYKGLYRFLMSKFGSTLSIHDMLKFGLNGI